MTDKAATTKPTAAPDFNRKSKIEENFKALKKYEDSRFGSVTIIEVPGNNKKLMVREKVFNSKTDIAAEINAAQKRLGIYDQHLLAFVDYSTGSKSDFCSTAYWIKLFFEFPDHDIDQELRRRSHENIIGFTSSELTHMLYQTIHAGGVLHTAGIYHGDICPQTIEMDNPEFYKLVERFGDLARPEEFQQTRVIKGGEIYSAPEHYLRIKNGKGKTAVKGTLPDRSMMTADVFNLGITILHAGIDEGVQSAYDKNGSINIENMEKLKGRFAHKFPENNLLVTTVFAMLEQDPTRRPIDFSTMEKELPPYSIVIQALETEKRKALQQGYNQYGQPTGNTNYNQYVANAQWEKNWTNNPNTQSTQPSVFSGPLANHMNLPHETYNPNAASQSPQPKPQQQQAPQGFGVIPKFGQGIQSYQPQPAVQTQQPGISYGTTSSTYQQPSLGYSYQPQTGLMQPSAGTTYNGMAPGSNIGLTSTNGTQPQTTTAAKSVNNTFNQPPQPQPGQSYNSVASYVAGNNPNLAPGLQTNVGPQVRR